MVVADNLCNSHETALHRVESLTGKQPAFYPVDIRDKEALRTVFAKHAIEAVIHFAGLIAVGESTRIPLAYFDNNVNGTVKLLEVMAEFDVRHLVFSSSATVYGDPHEVPIREDFPVGQVTNPYGRSKFMVEEILRDTAASDDRWNFSILRYFNPVGAHESGLIGEDPSGIPNNLMPYILPRWPLASWSSSTYLAMTTLPTMVPVCVTISMWSIWPLAIWRHCEPIGPIRASTPTTWVPAKAAVFWICCTPLKKPVANRCLTKSSHAAPGISPSVTPTPPMQSKSWAGKPPALLKI